LAWRLAVSAFESVQHGVMARGSSRKIVPQAADCAAGRIGGVAAKYVCTVQITKAVKGNAAEGSEPICASGKTVKNGFPTAAAGFEDGPLPRLVLLTPLPPLP
jgi:hypothetical protein